MPLHSKRFTASTSKRVIDMMNRVRKVKRD